MASIQSILLLVLISVAVATAAASPSIFELLPKYALPSGLLPASVSNYTLLSDGRFVVVLDQPCYIQFEYLVYYEALISGKLSYGGITDLKGVQVQRFSFFWFGVDDIRVDLPPSDCIYFNFGLINKKLDIDQFRTVRSCRQECSWTRVVQLPSSPEETKLLRTE